MRSLPTLVLTGILCTLVVTTYAFGPQFIHFLQAAHPELGKLVLLSPAEGLTVRLKLAILGGIVAWSPMAGIYLILKPRLRALRSKLLLPLIASYVTFIAGAALGMSIVFPVALRFLLNFTFPNVELTFSVANYVSSALSVALAFGLLLQIPVWLVTLVSQGVLTEKALRKHRKSAVLSSFILGAALTPADPVSQFIVAVPMWGTYEVSIIIASGIRRRKSKVITKPGAAVRYM